MVVFWHRSEEVILDIFKWRSRQGEKRARGSLSHWNLVFTIWPFCTVWPFWNINITIIWHQFNAKLLYVWQFMILISIQRGLGGSLFPMNCSKMMTWFIRECPSLPRVAHCLQCHCCYSGLNENPLICPVVLSYIWLSMVPLYYCRLKHQSIYIYVFSFKHHIV